ncbi:hypothetical protein OIV19_21735 [Brucella sp. HL-2]|nr:hypothetical protein [Brucella sp. HL-2]MCV9910219.1 hypothetical protein [Brucella sp. HL-2]
MKASIKRFLKRLQRLLPAWIWRQATEASPYAINIMGCIVFVVSLIVSGPFLKLFFLVIAFLLWAGSIDLISARAERNLVKQMLKDLGAQDRDRFARDHVEGAYKDFG